eukprot:scaffold19890_cov59-Phaeocystis_antarctica.AAC.1
MDAETGLLFEVSDIVSRKMAGWSCDKLLGVRRSLGCNQRTVRAGRRRPCQTTESESQTTARRLQSASRAGASAVVAALPPAGAEARP